ncbi:MAG: IS481 family transposase [Nitrospira sp.]|nr:IS481 family transposase [Nitrospira sp.]
MDDEMRRRFRWVRLYQETGDAGLVCRRCGISHPTLRKWVRRFDESGEDGLKSRSRRPVQSPNRRIFAPERALILDLRLTRKLGARRIQNELYRHHNLHLSLDTIHKVLITSPVPQLVRPVHRKTSHRYSRRIPGDRVQIDTCKIAPGCYQYTAVDDCSRYRVLAVFSRRTAAGTLAFLERVIEEMPFPVQRVQTDRGREFFAMAVQQWLMDHCMKFRPIKPASPHLNGKVERSQKTDREEFWAVTDPQTPDLELRLAEWQHYYNWDRPHGSLNGQSPIDVLHAKQADTPFWDEVEAQYDPTGERVQVAHYQTDLVLRRHTKARLQTQ